MTTVFASSCKQRRKSEDCYQQACRLVPGGVHSPVRSCKGLMTPPLIIDHGEGDTIVDIDGYRYIDFCCSWGALLHGHAHPHIVQAIATQASKGTSFGISTPLELALAERLLQYLPADQLRFVSSGTEATMTAIRVARGVTGRDLIIKFSGHYHGHSDSFLVQAGSGCLCLDATASSAGVPHELAKLTLCLPFNDPARFLEALERQNIAAVIVEPIAANMGLISPQEGFLQLLREETAKRGILLILDEVITGFRVTMGCVSSLYDLEPDLICLGKVIAGGMPAAALAGKASLMQALAPLGPVYQAGTLSGNPIAMAAGLASLDLAEVPNFYDNLETKTQLLTAPLQKLIEQKNLPACLHQVGSMFTLFLGQRSICHLEDVKKCDPELFRQFFLYMLDHNIYVAPSQYEAHFVSSMHTEEHLLHTRDVMAEFLIGLQT